MPAYPIEILNFGRPSFDVHHDVIKKLNSIQDDFIFVSPPERYKFWASRFERDIYTTNYLWDQLRKYRRECKGFHPFIIGIVHGYLESEELGNLFGSNRAEEGLAVVTTHDWEKYFAPPPLSVFLTYYFIRYAMSFVCPDVKGHAETRGCFFDKKYNKNDIKLSMLSGRICDLCHNTFEEAIDGHTYNSLLCLVEYLKNISNYTPGTDRVRPNVFIGSSSEGLNMAENIQLGLENAADCTIWTQGIFKVSRGYLESLVESLSEYNYAILILTPDDLTTMRGITGNSPRDNVIFELGLFMGKLGRERTFMVHCRDASLDLPSDLAGVEILTFRNRSDGNLSAALGPVCTRLKKLISHDLI